jgi:hypothetical protein
MDLVGRWRILEMDLWDRDAIDLQIHRRRGLDGLSTRADH